MYKTLFEIEETVKKVKVVRHGQRVIKKTTEGKSHAQADRQRKKSMAKRPESVERYSSFFESKSYFIPEQTKVSDAYANYPLEKVFNTDEERGDYPNEFQIQLTSKLPMQEVINYLTAYAFFYNYKTKQDVEGQYLSEREIVKWVNDGLQDKGHSFYYTVFTEYLGTQFDTTEQFDASCYIKGNRLIITIYYVEKN